MCGFRNRGGHDQGVLHHQPGLHRPREVPRGRAGPGEKLKQQRKHLQQEQQKLQDQQDAVQKKLAVVDSQINAGVITELMEGVGNSSIMTTAPTLADTGAGSGNSETTSSAPGATPANAGGVVKLMEDECATPK